MSKRPGSPLSPEKSSKITKFFGVKNVSNTAKESVNNDTAVPEMDLESLKNLFVLDDLTEEELKTRFDAIADALLSQFRLRITRVLPQTEEGVSERKLVHEDLQLMEIEFYLISPGVHEDPFTHSAPEQRFNLCWRVSRTFSSEHITDK